jgi:PhnB protein
MSVQLNPYLGFRDNAREAMEFYQAVFGGTLTVNTFKEFHASTDPAEDDLVMHAQLEGEHGVVFMGSDTPPRMEWKPGSNFSMSLSGDDEPVLRGWFDQLSDGGTVTMPLEPAPWGDRFGMCVDKFGVTWLVNVSGTGEGGGGS